MDASRFDRLTRTLSSRRTALGGLLGSLAGLLGQAEAEAAPCPRGKKRCRKTCIPKRQCCSTANCRPKATGRVCRRGKCVCSPARPRPCQGACIPRSGCCLDSECGSVERGTARCRNHTCVVACDFGWGDCDREVTNGCETNTQSDVDNCGACGKVCPGLGQLATNVTCVGGKCRLRRTFPFTSPDAGQAFIVPANGWLTIDAYGGRGGSGGVGEAGDLGAGGGGGRFGRGGRLLARLPVTAGEEFRVFVGNVGTDGSTGDDLGRGGSGGGNGATNGQSSPGGVDSRGGGGGGGGGASDVRRTPYEFAHRILTVGGGGGGGGAGGQNAFGSAGRGGAGGSGHVGGTGGGPGVSAGSAGAAGSPGGVIVNDATVEVLGEEVGENGLGGRVTMTYDEV